MPKMVKRVSVAFLFTSCLLLVHVAHCAKPTTTTTPASVNNVTTTTSKPAAAAKPGKKAAAKATTSTTTTTITPLEEDEEDQDEAITTEALDEETTTAASKRKAQSAKNDAEQKSPHLNRTSPATPVLPLDMYSEFYHLDVDKTKQLPAADDTSAKLHDVYVPVTLYDKPYQDVYIDNNGLITLGTSITQYQALQFPLPYAAIAPLYQDVDTRGEGFVRYQVVSRRDQLAQLQLEQQLEQQRQHGTVRSSNREPPAEDPIERATETIQHFFPRSAQNFVPEQVIIAQWEEVGYYNERTDKLNTYQTVIVSDNADSYVIFLYGQLEWDAADSKLGQPRMPGQAGFVGDRGYAYIIKEYGKPLEKLGRGTNVGRPGMYVFHIGRLSQIAGGQNGNGQIRGPEIATNSPDQDFTAYPSEARYGASPYGGSNDGARELQQLEQQQRRQQNNAAAGTYPQYDEYYGEQVDEYERRQREEADRRRQQEQQQLQQQQQQQQQLQQQHQTDPYEQQRREYYAQQERDRERVNNPHQQQVAEQVQPGIYPIVGQQTDQYGRIIPAYYGASGAADDQLRDNGNRNGHHDNVVDHNRLEAEERQLYDPRYEQHHEQQQQQQQPGVRTGPNDGTCTSQDTSKCDATAGICDAGCCRCQDGMVGNGVVCINPSEALRMHGTFSGTLDGEPINTATIFTHVMLNEGRIYGALGDVDPVIGARLTALLPTVATLGWLSAAGATAQHGRHSPNGLDIAGLEFVSNMQLKFSTGETATVRTTFNGHNDHDRDVVARVDIAFDGQLPDESVYGAAPNSAAPLQLSSNDLQISYLKTSPGVYKAEWNMPLNVDAEPVAAQSSPVNVSVTETITYRECPQLREEDAPTEVHLLLERPYGLWQNDSKASRFSVTARLNDAESRRQFAAASLHGGQPRHEPHHEQPSSSYTPHYREGFYGQGVAPTDENGEQPPYAVGGYDPYYEAAQRERQHQQDEERRRLEANVAAAAAGQPDFRGHEHVSPPAHGESGNGNGNSNGNGNGNGHGTGEVLVPNESASNACERLPMPESATCTVQEGQARYDCVPGLRVAEWLPYGDSAYKPRCEDVDECLYGQDNCADDAECINTIGSFTCTCKSGFSGDGTHCTPATGGGAPNGGGGGEGGGVAVVNVPPAPGPGIYPIVPPYEPQPSAVAVECARLSCAAEATCVMNPEYSKPECRCNPGYRGDGYVCMPDNPQTANCLQNRGMCDANADCNADGRCTCREGYAGDGTICIDADEQCNVQGNCHSNAKCTYNPQDGSYLCKCLPGYTGDGYQCQSDNQPALVDPKDCSRYPKICDANAQCILDRTENAYRCRCYPGYTGPGIMCSRIPLAEASEDNCYLNPQMCHSNAACRPTSTGTYACKCLGNYFGDGVRSCSPAPRGGFIVYTQGQAVMRKYVDANAIDPGEEIVSLRGQTAVGIAVDCRQNYVYWSDIRTNTIQRINYKDKSNKATVFDKEIGSPEGMVIDPVSRNIFWTDSQRDQVVVANIDHPESGAKVIVTGNLTNPRGIAILPQRGYVFWTDWNRQEPKIERADMDGNNRRVLFHRDSPIGLQLPNAIAVCPITERIYWADAGTHKIMSADLDGQDGQIVYDQARYPFSMALLDNTLYWSDWEKNKIMYVGKTGGQAKELDRPLTASGRVYGIATVPDVCPNSLNSRCADSSTLCRFICLPLPQGRDECVCPDGVNPAECQQSTPLPYYQRR